jgi:hypothetical protein
MHKLWSIALWCWDNRSRVVWMPRNGLDITKLAKDHLRKVPDLDRSTSHPTRVQADRLKRRNMPVLFITCPIHIVGSIWFNAFQTALALDYSLVDINFRSRGKISSSKSKSVCSFTNLRNRFDKYLVTKQWERKSHNTMIKSLCSSKNYVTILYICSRIM